MKKAMRGLTLLLCAVILIFPLMTIRDSEFGGADGAAGACSCSGTILSGRGGSSSGCRLSAGSSACGSSTGSSAASSACGRAAAACAANSLMAAQFSGRSVRLRP